MYPQHERATQNLVALFKKRPGGFGGDSAGSPAKGLERLDSDVDAIIAVTEEKYRRLQAEGRTSECIEEGCGYEGGYFDLKYYTKDYLQAPQSTAASPPATRLPVRTACFPGTRNCRELSRDPGFQEAEKEEKMLSFYAALFLYGDYFLGLLQAGNRYLQVKSAAMTVLYGLRLVLKMPARCFLVRKA